MLRHPVFASLPPAERDAFFKQCKLTSVRKGEVLVERGKRYDSIFIVARGMLRMEIPVHREDGPLATVAILNKYDFVGETIGKGQTDYEAFSTITAVLDSDVFSVPAIALYKLLMAHPSALIQLFMLQRQHLVRSRRQIARLLGGTVEEKVGATLYELSQAGGEDIRVVDKRVSQKLVAAVAGMSREQVNKTIKLLEGGGLLRKTDEGYEVQEGLAPSDAQWDPKLNDTSKS